MGQRDGFSPRDLQKVNSMYNCDMGGQFGGNPQPPFGGNPQPQVPQAPQRPQGGRPNLFLSFLGGVANGLGFKDGTNNV